MKNKYLSALLGLSVVLALSACSKTKEETEAPAAEKATEAVSEEVSEEVLSIEYGETESESSRPLDAITPSDYLVADIDDYITPGELEGLSATQYTYEITDELLQEQIDMELEMYSEEIEVDRASSTGDYIYVDLTYTVQGSDEAETDSESTFFMLGDEEYGADFDAALTGASTGETLTFSITFDSDSDLTDWAGKTVDFTAEISGVVEVNIPELDETFVQEYTGYDTVDEYKTALKEAMEEEYEEVSLSDVYSSLIDMALENCIISSPPDDLLESCREELIEEYGAFFGTTDETELLDIIGMTSDDIDAEASQLAERRLLISYICEKNDLSVSEEDYDSYAEQTAEDYGYSSAYDFEQDFTRTGLIWTLYEEKASEWLYQHATVTTTSYEDSVIDDEDWDLEEAETGEVIYETEDILTEAGDSVSEKEETLTQSESISNETEDALNETELSE